MRIACLEMVFAGLLLAVPLPALAETDACTVLTPAQVAAAVGEPVSAGQHVTPTFVKTCTWTPTGTSQITAITLNLQTARAYDGGKQMAAIMKARGASITSAAVGDDAYYSGMGSITMLFVKTGDIAFKVAVYARIPRAKLEAMELALAKAALAKLR